MVAEIELAIKELEEQGKQVEVEFCKKLRDELLQTSGKITQKWYFQTILRLTKWAKPEDIEDRVDEFLDSPVVVVRTTTRRGGGDNAFSDLNGSFPFSWF